MESIYSRCEDLIQELKLGAADTILEIKPLSGGVSSDIAKVVTGTNTYCLKFALPKLKVAEDWLAPVHRNKAEYQWLQAAAQLALENAVQLYGHSERLQGFAMEYIQGADVFLWKDELLNGRKNSTDAEIVATQLGKIHQGSAAATFDKSAFQNKDDFHALRLEPYLLFTATIHETLHEPLTQLANKLYDNSTALVHGDVSPKNILFRQQRAVLLDAECATIGDPAFDVAFCMNHLILKAIHLTDSRSILLNSLTGFWRCYEPCITWEDPAKLNSRLCELIPALMLARIDGKSPVEYLDEQERELVRQLAIRFIQAPEATLSAFLMQLKAQIKM